MAPPPSTAATKLRLMCSYLGGDTHIVSLDRNNTTLHHLLSRLSKTLRLPTTNNKNKPSFTLKYQLPNEDLDFLITLSTQEDLDNMVDEYDRLCKGRIRLFVFPNNGTRLIESNSSSKCNDEWFVATVNKNEGNYQDVQSVPDSPRIETNSSLFGSSCSEPGNLPEIRVRVEQRVGIEEKFCEMCSPPPDTGGPAVAGMNDCGGGGGELLSPDSVSSDNSYSSTMSRQKPILYHDPVGNQLPSNMINLNAHIQIQPVSETGYTFIPQHEQQPQIFHQQHQQLQQVQQQGQPQSQPQQYIPAGVHFVHHPHARVVPLSTYYQMYPPQQPQHNRYQCPVYYISAGQAQAYSLPVQVQQPQNLGETPTAISSSSHPQAPANPTIIATSSTYNQTKNVPQVNSETSGVYQPAVVGSQLVQVFTSQLQPQSQSQSQSLPQPQMQQQFMGYSQIHHPSQSIAPNPVANASAYAYANPAHAQIYYTQPLTPTMVAQYQTVTSSATKVLPDDGSHSGNDNIQQQVQSSQPL